jgi:hypothetical protein
MMSDPVAETRASPTAMRVYSTEILSRSTISVKIDWSTGRAPEPNENVETPIVVVSLLLESGPPWSIYLA